LESFAPGDGVLAGTLYCNHLLIVTLKGVSIDVWQVAYVILPRNVPTEWCKFWMFIHARRAKPTALIEHVMGHLK
jgi:hypothetical protein